MNTVKKGNIFEDKVFNILKEELENGRLPFSIEYAKLFKKKAYYSRERGSNIIVDISIEIFIPGEKDWFSLYIIECKDYNSNVPVNDVEELDSKVQQIAGLKGQGILVSSNSFQSGTFNYAKSRGIGIIRILDDDKIKWVLTRKSKLLSNYNKNLVLQSTIHSGITENEFSHDNIDFFSFTNGIYTNSIYSFFQSSVNENLEKLDKLNINIAPRTTTKKYNAPYINKNIIENITNELLDKYHFQDLDIPIEKFCKILEKDKNVKINFNSDIGFDAFGSEILGKIQFNPTIIFISKFARKNYHRFKFTIAHELGHFILNHGEFYILENYSEREYKSFNLLGINSKEIKLLEWQANYFASVLLLPKNKLKNEIKRLSSLYNISNKGFGMLYVDNQPCNLDNFYNFTDGLKNTFNVSRQAIEIRLKDLKLLNDKRT